MYILKIWKYAPYSYSYISVSYLRLDDEWVEMPRSKRHLIRKRMKLCNLPVEAKCKVARELFGTPHSQIISEDKEKPKVHPSSIDTSWIKVERDEESRSKINNQEESKQTRSEQCTRSKRKQNRKYHAVMNNNGVLASNLYNSSFYKPPSGLF